MIIKVERFLRYGDCVTIPPVSLEGIHIESQTLEAVWYYPSIPVYADIENCLTKSFPSYKFTFDWRSDDFRTIAQIAIA